jgi:hypothetical protein
MPALEKGAKAILVTALIRNGCSSSQVPPGSLASGGSALKIPGGKFSWVSQLVSTSRPICSGRVVTRTWETAPPESLPTTMTSSSSSRSISSATIAARPTGERSASGDIGMR